MSFVRVQSKQSKQVGFVNVQGKKEDTLAHKVRKEITKVHNVGKNGCRWELCGNERKAEIKWTI